MYKLELILEEPDRVYFSGDDVKGNVIVNLESSLAVQAVTVKFIGEACVSVPDELVDSKGPKKPRKNVTNKITPVSNEQGKIEAAQGWVQGSKEIPSTPHKTKKASKQIAKSKLCSQERYFFHNEYLYGHKYSSYREQLWEGSHVFPFQFTLPTGLPASFNGRFGYVRYYCESTLQRWKIKDTRRVYFSVTNVADINTEAKAESGCEEQKTTNSCLFCCPRGTIVASAELKRRGFAPGEIAPLLVEIHNMSNTSITSLKAVIIQMVEYSSPQGMRRHEDERKVLEVTRGEVKPGTSLSWGTAGIRLPPLPPTSFTADSCKIISIHYRIDVLMYVTGEKEPLILKLPIIIGNIPLKKNFSLLADSELGDSLHAVAFPKHITHRYCKLPAATTQESVNPEQSDCVYKLPHFKPRYLVYYPNEIM
ncbi:arrestin domain-containing protein 17-like [Cimex lectularius]|uniref:Arrestin C-terminal-like domain-containing protein n=1 Tax=Cimex lectularius TaxID=79782 RepID=A0A8I6RYK6_CIMLE|nr:arrestin domain-containing protein 17-like [Cimex lectularius]